ncbi:SDR family NAD(P)-dependent oxidoreductase [Rufibacter glacialis]|uniref:SDR family NAD(P)-dependent oxidoreductase n=1 Tax=Rufibacter glacialis TaxID=1259555 RepID=A0A5M8QRI0_9BACT|nr:SDR family oxidoreductase [Rufibacter glacialis]KAA6437660.1 SDR family oxidoreductase [Rufibacter glacialis]GGK57422.1 ketoacyl reductase [Rufibacter glacialis]
MKKKTKKNLLWAGAGLGAWLALRSFSKNKREFSFTDRTVLITGGSRGLGLVLARMFAEQGAKLAICSRTQHQLEAAREELEAGGATVLAFNCDVTDRTQVKAMVAEIKERLGPVEVLINNAGIIAAGPLEEMQVEDFEVAMNVHYWASLYTMLEVIPEMRARGEGRIVNIASIGGKVSVPHLVPYSGSKFALVGMSEGFRSELLKDGIYVTTINPGLMRTGSARNAFLKGQNEKEYTAFALLDANPIISLAATVAARKIIDACRFGKAEVTLGLNAKFISTLHGLFPGATADLMGLVNMFLPGPGGVGKEAVRGYESETALTQSPLNAPNQKAAQENNEL